MRREEVPVTRDTEPWKLRVGESLQVRPTRLFEIGNSPPVQPQIGPELVSSVEGRVAGVDG